MNIKNYTSSVPVINSISKIEFRLAQAGATHIAKSYEKEKPVGMIFQIPVNGIPLTFKLPAKIGKVTDFLIKQRSKPPKPDTKKTIELQAERTAWKILADWIDIQVSIIQLDQAEPAEVFLPYSYNPASDQTLFEMMNNNGFNQLTAGGE